MGVKIKTKAGKEIVAPAGHEVKLGGLTEPTPYRIEAGWDGVKADIDISVIGRDNPGESWLACYHDDLNPEPWIEHSSDDTTGESSQGGADEWINITDANQADPKIAVLDVFVNVDQVNSAGLCWGDFTELFVEITDKNGNKIRVEQVAFDLMAVTDYSMHVARITRKPDGWYLKEVSNKYRGYTGDAQNPVIQSFADQMLPPGDM
ncbi:TerD family protein [Candidatus Woesebacteria bacterium]|nr:TerD family protein [Candidatus Woesebacteria bacterium]